MSDGSSHPQSPATNTAAPATAATVTATAAPPLVEWGPGKTARGRARLPSSRRRDRPQLSCNLCRQRKLRCDRQLPCTNCAKRIMGSSCSYPTWPPQTAGARVGDVSPSPDLTQQDRIRYLEQELVGLARSHRQQHHRPHVPGPPRDQAPSGPSTPGAASPATTRPCRPSSPAESDCGSTRLTRSGTSYVNSAHWAAVLDGIDDLKGHLEDEKSPPQHGTPVENGPLLFGEAPAPRLSGPQLLYGCSAMATKEEILASVPTRPFVDQLISCYFNSFELSPAVLHSGQFLHEYEEFWKRPSASPIVWVGLLFTLMCLASQFQRHRLDPGEQTTQMLSARQHLQDRVEAFQQRAVQCLVVGDYIRGGPHVLETLVLYLAAELFRSSDAEPGMWMLVGTMTQIATRMGYHRDPRHFAGLSPLAAEMHRRVWMTMVEIDLGVSAQMGLPRTIRPWQADTAEPANLLDRDLDLGARELPPPRPETDLTPILFRIVRARISRVMGAIWDLATSARPHRHADVLSLDADLEAAHAAIPECLRWRSGALCIADPPQAVMQKVMLEINVHRARVVLHRGYVRPPAGDARQYGCSRHKCLGAALRLLEFQEMLREQTEPLGQLSQERWRVSSPITHHFLLAVSVLCSYLQQAHGGDDDDDENGDDHDESCDDGIDITRSAIRDALRRSHDIWARSSGLSREAQKAAKALSVVLGIESSAQAAATTAPDTPATPYPAAHANVGELYQENAPDFGFNFPVFNEMSCASWPGQGALEPMAFLTLAPAATDLDAGTADWTCN
ncbi:hypothetical protein RB594_001103 [Gaeumannomyces avenae]